MQENYNNSQDSSENPKEEPLSENVNNKNSDNKNSDNKTKKRKYVSPLDRKHEFKNSLVAAGADIDTCLKAGRQIKCMICNHHANIESVIFYFNCEKNHHLVRKWFKEKHFVNFPISKVQFHFENHIEGYITKEMARDELSKRDLIERSLKRPNIDRFALMREMTWDLMMKAYTNLMDLNISDSKNRTQFKEMAKAHTDLVKAHNDICQKEWDMIGQGRSDEEQKKIMRNYIVNTIKKNLNAIKDDYPEAYSIIASKIGIETPVITDLENDDG